MARQFFFLLALAYPVIIALLATPVIQRHVAFQHAILPFPLFAKFDMPEKYTLAPGKTRNLQMITPDSITLGAWFMLSDPYHQQLCRAPSDMQGPPSIDTIQAAISRRPTVLYFHGAAGSRAIEWRVRTYSGLTSRLQTNVLSIDYRGFGDSAGSPNEHGLALDAYTAWTWLIEQGAKPEDILIIGHSLGTGVAGQLAKRLTAEGVRARGVVLLAPFTSFSSLIETYSILGIPILQPLQTFPLGIKLIKLLMRHEFDTLSTIQDFNVPTLIAHSLDDFDIPYSHSRTLVDKLLEPLLPELAVDLPSAPGTAFSSEDFAAFSKARDERRAARSALVRKKDIPNFGTVEEFGGDNTARVVYVETFWGSHAYIGAQEGVQDEIGKFFNLL